MTKVEICISFKDGGGEEFLMGKEPRVGIVILTTLRNITDNGLKMMVVFGIK